MDTALAGGASLPVFRNVGVAGARVAGCIDRVADESHPHDATKSGTHHPAGIATGNTASRRAATPASHAAAGADACEGIPHPEYRDAGSKKHRAIA